MPDIREPKKVTSIDKKNRIIIAGLKLFGEVGYYNTNTAEIAKEAGVSTGIVYNYFMDKKDILMYAIKIYYNNIYNDFINALESSKDQCDIQNYKKGDIFKILLPVAIESHSKNINVQKSMIGMCYLDSDVNKVYNDCLNKMVKEICDLATTYTVKIDHLEQKALISYHMVEDLCYEINFNEKVRTNKEDLINETAEAITKLFN